MDWIREHKKLATIVGIFVAGALALGALLFMSNSGYAESLETFTSMAGKVAMMEKAPLYPNEENVNAFDEKVTAFENEVSKLGGVLLKLQTPVVAITDTDFQARLKQRIAEIKTKAATGTTQLPKDFAFGFDVYTQSLPRSPEAARELGDFFNAVDAVVVAAMDSGVRSIDSLSRSDLAIEKDAPPAPKPAPVKKESTFGKKKGTTTKKAVAPPKEIAKVVERRQLKLAFTADQKALQTLTNTLSSASKLPYYTFLRIVRIENEKQTGPLRSALSTGEGPVGGKPSTTPVVNIDTPAPPPDGAEPAAPKAEVIEAPKPAPADATAVLGGELLKVFFEIDLVRFVEPSPEAN
jgi:hypothetical protein